MDDLKKLHKLHADVCKALAHSKRIEIIHVLQDTEMPAGELAKKLDISKSNLSQHLSLMKEKGILHERKEGLNVYYSITSNKVTRAFSLMRELLIENLSRKSNILSLVK